MEIFSESKPDTDHPGRSLSAKKFLLLVAPALFIIFILFGGGLFFSFLQALGYQFSGGLQGLTLSHFYAVLNDPDFLKSLGLTLYISTTSTIIAAALSIILSLAIMRWATNNRFINFILQIPLAVPHLVIAISVLLLLSPTGLLARILSSSSLFTSPSGFPLLVNDPSAIGILTVYIWKEIPFITFMLLSVLKNIGTELMDVGSTLNAGSLQRFLHITLPLIAPNLCSACLIVFAFTFGAFEVPYLLGQSYPLVLPVWAYRNYSDIDLLSRPEGIAIGFFIAFIIICLLTIAQLLLQLGRNRRKYL